MWRDNTQVSYFGQGPGAVQDDQSQYRLKSTDVAGYAALRPTETLTFTGELGWIRRPQIQTTAGAFNPDYAQTQVAFPDAPAMSLAVQPNFLRSEFSVALDTRQYRGHPTSGGLYRAGVTVYSDESAGTFSFDQYEAEAVQLVPIAGERIVFAGHAWTVFTDVPNGHDVPFYLMPVLGGNNTLRAFDDYQFHDRNTLLVNAEVRLALTTHIDAAAFVDAGNVAFRYGDLNLDKRSYGAGVRIHTARATFGRLDVAHGSEGWRFVFRTTEPLKISRLSRHTAIIPAVP
jgi:outer membrane protein assembly factor BamA